MATYTQSGSGAQLNESQIKSGTFSPDTFFIESGTGARKMQQDFSAAPAAPVVASPTAPPSTDLQTPVAAPATIKAPTLPTPTAPTQYEDYLLSVTGQAKQTRGAVENAYKTALEPIKAERLQAEENVRNITKDQGDLLEKNVQPLMQPFREKLETSERSRLKVEDNYFANQKLVDELDSLLTEGNALISRTKALPISQQALDKRTAKTMSDVAARTGVIQAVLAARNGQIAQAENFIDRSVQAVNADRQDQLGYYKAVLDFYENVKDEEGKKVAELKKDEKDFLTAQIGLLENDMKQTDESVQTIKKAMMDPDTAQAYGQAGVTLNDTSEVIGKKLATYAYQKEVIDLSNDMASKGYTYLVPGQAVPGGAEVVTVTDSKGARKEFYKKDSGSGGAKTEEERRIQAISEFSSAFVPGATMEDGTPILDESNFVTPIAWKAAIADAPLEGLTRKSFIEQFGHLLYSKDGKIDPQYGLTPTEQKLLTGEL